MNLELTDYELMDNGIQNENEYNIGGNLDYTEINLLYYGVLSYVLHSTSGWQFESYECQKLSVFLILKILGVMELNKGNLNKNIQLKGNTKYGPYIICN